MIPSVSFLWSHRRPFPPVSNTVSVWSFFFILGGYLWFQHLRHGFTISRSIGTPTSAIIFFTFLVVLYPAALRSNLAYFHPIDMLIYDAKSQHKHYESYATQSYNLDEAVAQYRRRYKMTPPPAFETWYQYALIRNSVVMDRYDQIYYDMLPFWSIPSSQLRQSTWELMSNPWNDIGGITIRDGTASVLDNIPGTHRWMLDGVVAMINKFSQHLPDMDLAFNLNDEARVAVPNRDIERLRQAAVAVDDRSGKQSWSAARADGWPAISEEPFPGTILQDMSFQNTFFDFGSASCEPSSPARAIQDLYSHSHLCLSCTEPHSLGQFLSNWSLSADICHQPDMANLHGFYLSPAAFRGSHALVPIFTQSKPHGFHDILYPSAWNYMDKAVYAPTDPSGDPNTENYNPGHADPPFEAKHNTLFWRGATSEGVSSGDHTWRGMTRQRLVHLANNLTSSAHDAATILLPTESKEGSRYRYTIVPGNTIKDLGLSTDIAIVDRIARCGGSGLHDCKDQEAEFALVPPADFQSHWQYRYLFDLDGAGFSGRFLAFLQSHSLPFKTALFREWYDERMTAWHHFVPLDIRLHAVWSTLAYFAGANGTLPGGRWVEMAPHLKEGERIAEQGRDWAGKVLRKEDMEIYFFRVLLEWGRLTDDNRENLGFLPDGDNGGGPG
jgi:Glycosyl transferase family 90